MSSSEKTPHEQTESEIETTPKAMKTTIFTVCCETDNRVQEMATSDAAMTTIKKPWHTDIFNVETLRVGLAELIGTFLLVLFGCMGCVSWSESGPPLYQIATSFGMVVMFIIQIFGHVSGAHLNPSITLAGLISGITSVPIAMVYFIAQMIGGIGGYGVLLALTPDEVHKASEGLCVTIPPESVGSVQAILVEALATAVLVLVTCAVWDPCNAKNSDSTALKFGFTIAALAMAAGSYTGASMNPVRSFAPAMWKNNWSRHWIYWVGPLVGSGLSAFLYHTVFRRDRPDSQPEEIPLNERSKNAGETA